MSPNPVGAKVEQMAQAIAERVVSGVLELIDINAIVQTIDIDAVVSKVDIDAIVGGLDIDAIVQKLDIDAIVARIDIDAVVKRVDINAIVNDLDIDSLMQQTELGSIIAKSTTGVFTEILDVIRSQGVGLDDFLARWTNKILRRDVSKLPVGPVLLIQQSPTIGDAA